MRILLVDDAPKHRRAGHAFANQHGHEITVLSSYVDAYFLAQQEHFDIALVDLFMPAEAVTLGQEGLKHLGSEIGVGYVLAISLAYAQVDRIVVVTDTNHHDHPLSATVDWLKDKELSINGKPVRFIHARLNPDGAKDWAHAFASVVS